MRSFEFLKTIAIGNSKVRMKGGRMASAIGSSFLILALSALAGCATGQLLARSRTLEPVGVAHNAKPNSATDMDNTH